MTWLAWKSLTMRIDQKAASTTKRRGDKRWNPTNLDYKPEKNATTIDDGGSTALTNR